MDIVKGFKTSEFWRVAPIYLLAGIALWKGYDVKQIHGLVNDYAGILSAVVSGVGVIAAAIDNGRFINSRMELKKHKLEKEAEILKHKITVAEARKVTRELAKR